MDLNDFLVWLSGAGGIIAVSYFAEKSSWFQAKSSEAKQWLIFGASAVLAIGAYSVVTYVSPALLSQLAPFFTILSTLFASIFVGQAFHASSKTE